MNFYIAQVAVKRFFRFDFLVHDKNYNALKIKNLNHIDSFYDIPTL